MNLQHESMEFSATDFWVLQGTPLQYFISTAALHKIDFPTGLFPNFFQYFKRITKHCMKTNEGLKKKVQLTFRWNELNFFLHF